MINKNTLQKGFTLIETLVAVLLLTVAIAGPLTVASRALTSALVAKDQVTAYYLAQDAMEYIRFRRDNACLAAFVANSSQTCLAANTWLSYFSSGWCNSPGYCKVDTINTGTVPSSCVPTNTTCALNYNSSLKRYSLEALSGTTVVASKYKRYVQLSNTPTTKEVQVTVTVAWPANGVTGAGCPTNHRCVVLKEYMFNWQ